MLAQMLRKSLHTHDVHCRDRLPKMLFSHERFPDNVSLALASCIATLDEEVNAGNHCALTQSFGDLIASCNGVCRRMLQSHVHIFLPVLIHVLADVQRLTRSSAALLPLYARLSVMC